MTSLAEGIAGQFRTPSGLAGRAFAAILNRGNRRINERAVGRLAPGSTDDVLEIGFGGGAALAAILARTGGFAARSGRNAWS